MISPADKKFVFQIISSLLPRLKARWQNFIRPDRLSSIWVDISGQCNLACTMCDFQRDYKNKGLMPPALFERLSAAIPKLDELHLQSNCEPLLNPDIVPMIRFARKLKPDLYIFFTTNGTLFTRDLSRELLAAGVNEIRISLDSPVKATYETIRRGSDFDLVLRNLRDLLELRETTVAPVRCKIGLTAVASVMNLEELPALLDLAADLKVDIVHLNGLVPHEEAMADKVLWAAWGQSPDARVVKIFADLKRRARELRLLLEMPPLKAKRVRHCYLNTCLIHANGDVSPCFLLSYERACYFGEQKQIFPKTIFGNIRSQDLFSIWNTPDYRAFRKASRRGCLQPCCRTCAVRTGIL